MILNRLYDDFILHTNLSDPVYKSVFQKLSEVISNLNAIKWNRLIYTMNGQVYDIDFNTNRILPVHIIDLLQNVFEHNFLFPSESTTVVQVEYNNNPYEIRVEDGITKIPSEIDFLLHSKLFSFFYVSKPVINLFDEFNTLFQIFDSFKIKQYNVYSLLEKQFEGDFIQNETVQPTEDTYLEDTLRITVLENQRNECLQELNSLTEKKEALLHKKDLLSKGFANKELLENNYNAFLHEASTTKTVYTDLLGRMEDLTNMIAELNESISGLNDSIQIIEQQPEQSRDHNLLKTFMNDKQYFTEKRLIFDKELLSVKQAAFDNSKLLEELNNQLRTKKAELDELNQCTVQDIESIDLDIYNCEKDHNDCYTKVTNIDYELQGLKSKMKQKPVAKAASLTDVNVQLIEKKDIVDHLSKPLKPQAVIVVENYLRYYFYYYVKKAVDAVTDSASIEIEWLNAIMARQVLETYFGVQPHTLFSTIAFNPKTVKNFINVSRG